MGLQIVNIIFGMKVRQARTEAGLTLSEFAGACELSPSYRDRDRKGAKISPRRQDHENGRRPRQGL